MNLSRANEKPIEWHGDARIPAGGVQDWQADRLAVALGKLESIFNAALAEQQRQGPVSAEVALQIQATVSDLGKAAHAGRESFHSVLTTTERLVGRLEFEGAPQQLKAGSSTEHIVGQLAQLANQEFATSTFYGISEGACQDEARLQRMCERAHALVAAGYVGEKELEGVRVAVTDTTSIQARAAGAFHRIAETADLLLPVKYSEDSRSYFRDNGEKFGGSASVPTITISKDESREFGGKAPEPEVGTFSHEIGHWLARDKTGEILSAGVDAVRDVGGPDASHLDQFYPKSDLSQKSLSVIALQDGGILTQSMRFHEVSGTSVPVSWLKMVYEMEGDLMQIAAENAEFGRGAALVLGSTVADFRDKERLTDLAGATEELQSGVDPTKVRFAEEHFTSAAVRDFTDKVREGRLDQVHTPEQLDKLIGESIVRGLMSEYVQVRSAELNIHHIENGTVVPGPPPGVDMKDLLVAEMAHKVINVPGHPTLVLTAEDLKRWPEAVNAESLNLPGPGQGATGEKVYLSQLAPEGVTMPAMMKGTQEVAGFTVANSMASLAKDIVARADAYRDTPSHGTAKFDNLFAQTPERVLGHELGSPKAGQVEASEQKAEAAQQRTAEMAM
jgi:hypothetical protein